MEQKEINHIDWIKHYFASLLIYGIILLFLIFSPAYYETITNDKFDYTVFFSIYYIGYMLFAPLFFALLMPNSVLNSRSLTILRYFKRQLKLGRSTEQFLSDIEPQKHEKLAFMTLFIQTFFGVYCVNLLCNRYIPDLGYNLDFVKTMALEAYRYIAIDGGGIVNGILQFLIDSGDVWLKLIMTLTLIILAFSYLTELKIFRNKVKSADTTPLGVLSCIVCYYPVTILTDKFIRITNQTLMPVNNSVLLAILNLLAIFANLGILISVLSLGTKAGNLTNRGIVKHFPYNIIRHPDYSMQIFYILITTVPLFLIQEQDFIDILYVICGTLTWIYFYYLRAITEERHLLNDPEYKEYTEKVKYRFIPKLI